MRKGPIHWYDEKIINAYKQNQRTPKYMEKKKTELKGELGTLAIIVGDLYTPISVIGRWDGQQVTWLEASAPQLTLLADICRMFPPNDCRIHSVPKFTWNIFLG